MSPAAGWSSAASLDPASRRWPARPGHHLPLNCHVTRSREQAPTSNTAATSIHCGINDKERLKNNLGFKKYILRHGQISSDKCKAAAGLSYPSLSLHISILFSVSCIVHSDQQRPASVHFEVGDTHQPPLCAECAGPSRWPSQRSRDHGSGGGAMVRSCERSPARQETPACRFQ